MRARAPGKVVLSGAYAVLEGAPAIVAAVDRYVIADASIAGSRMTDEMRAAGFDAPCWFDATALRHEDRKLGLGSSAAIVVAALASRHLGQSNATTQRELAEAVYARALSAHRAAQGGGSGIDVAAACFGGILRFQRPPCGDNGSTEPLATNAQPVVENAPLGIADTGSATSLVTNVNSIARNVPTGDTGSAAPRGSAGPAAPLGAAVDTIAGDALLSNGAHASLRVASGPPVSLGEPVLSELRLPADLFVEVWCSSSASSTAEMLRLTRQYAARAPDAYRLRIDAQAQAARLTVAAWEQGNLDDLLQAFCAQRHALQQLGDTVGIPIVTPQVAKLADIAEAHGAAVLPAGAGGGDIALYVGRAPADFMSNAIARMGHFRPPIRLGALGVHRVADSNAPTTEESLER